METIFNPSVVWKNFIKCFFDKENSSTRNQTERALIDKRSILDLAKNQADNFKKSLGYADTEKLDQYFTSVREFEKRIEQSTAWLDKEKPNTDYSCLRVSIH